jgi:predicted AAA+ superfamily ATPase
MSKPGSNPQILAFVRNQLTQSEALLKTLTYSAQGQELPRRNLYPKLSTYINDFLQNRTDPRWIAVAGLRGVGKTTLLAQLYTHSQNEGVRKLYISLDRASDLGFSLSDLLAAYEELIGTALERFNVPILLFLDEVQYQPTWARTVKTLFDRTRNVFVIATGSSAVAVQTNPDIDRRMVLEKMYPLKFSEYVQAKLHRSLPTGLDERIRAALFSSANVQEVHARLKKEAGTITDYYTGIDRFEIDRYLKFGSLPFALNLSNEQLVYQQIQRLVENIITKDVTQLNAFDKPTLSKISQLLYAIAGADVASISKLANTLGIDPKTVIQALDTLEKTEVLLRVYPYGAHYGQVKKPSKYLFTSSTYRAMYYNLVGSIEQYDLYKGRLLEDVVGVSLFHMFGNLPGASIAYDSAKSGADFILTTSTHGEKIILEVGMGKKDFEQAENTLRKVGGKYGLVISQAGLKLSGEGQCISVPLEYFLLA